MKHFKALFSLALIFVMMLQATATSSVADFVQDMLVPMSEERLDTMYDDEENVATYEETHREPVSPDVMALFERADLNDLTIEEETALTRLYDETDKDYDSPEATVIRATARQLEQYSLYNRVKSVTYTITQDDIREIGELKDAYSNLSDEDIDIINRYLGGDYDANATELALLEHGGYTIFDSVMILRTTNDDLFSISEAKRIHSMYEHSELELELAQLYEFIEKQQSGFGGEDVVSWAKESFLNGYRAASIETAHTINRALEIREKRPLLFSKDLIDGKSVNNAILNGKTDTIDSISRLNKAEQAKLSSVIKSYPLDEVAILAYVERNGLTVEQFEQFVQNTITSTSSISTDEEIKFNVVAPFTAENSQNEYVDLNTGTLKQELPLFNIPGRNGMDLNLSLQYNLNKSNLYDETFESYVRYTVFTQQLTLNTYNYPPRDQRYYSNSYEKGTFDVYNDDDWYNLQNYLEELGTAYDPIEWDLYRTENTINYVTTCAYHQNCKRYHLMSITYLNDKRIETELWEETVCDNDYYGVDIYLGEFEYYGNIEWSWIDDSKTEYINENIREDLTYNQARYNLGTGWSLNLPSIETSLKAVHLANGSVIPFTGSGSTYSPYTLKDYKLQDLKLEKYNSNIHKTVTSSNYVLIYKDGREAHFDNAGKLLAQADRYGNIIRYKYNSSGYISEIIEGSSDINCRKISFSYNDINSKERMVTITAYSEANMSSYTLTLTKISGHDDWMLKSITDDIGSVTEFKYKDDGKATTSFNLYNMYEFDIANGENYYTVLTEIKYPTGGITKYEYEKSDRDWGEYGHSEYYRIKKRHDKNDEFSSESYNAKTYAYVYNFTKNNVYSVIVQDVVGSETLSTTHYFDKDHLLKQSVTTGGGYTIEEDYEYNSHNLMTLKTISTKNGSSVMTSVEKFEYDKNPTSGISKGNLIGYWSPLGYGIANGTPVFDPKYKTTYGYNSMYNQLIYKSYWQNSDRSIEEIYTTSENNLTIDSYIIKEYNGASNGIEKEKTTYGYDNNYNLTSSKQMIDATNFVTTNYVYGPIGTTPYYSNLYVTEIHTTGVKDADNYNYSQEQGITIINYYTYDLMGNIKSTRDGRWQTTEYEYDGANRLTRITNPDRSYQSYDYIVNTATNSTVHINELGLSLTYDYDQLGNLLTVRDTSGMRSPSNNQILLTYEYDNVGRVVLENNINDSDDGTRISYDYDVFGRLTNKTIKNKANTVIAQETYEYNDAHTSGYRRVQKTVVGSAGTNPSIVTTSYTNEMGFVVQTGVIYGNTEKLTEYKHDYVGNVLSEKDRLNNTTKWEYDYAGRVTKTTYENETYSTNGYDMLGRLTSTTDARGNTANYIYDVLGRLIIENLPFEDSMTTTNRYYYDGNGNMTRKMEGCGYAGGYRETEYDYNNRNFMTLVTVRNGPYYYNRVEYEYDYDLVGNVRMMRTGSERMEYEYDLHSRLTLLTDALGMQEVYTYDTNGNMLTKKDRNGNTTTYKYDGLGRTTRAQNSNDNTFIEYKYGLTGVVLTESSGTGSTASQTVNYVYDTLGRLTNEHEINNNNASKTYGYDLNGNMESFVLRTGGTTSTNGTIRQRLWYTYDNMNRMKTVRENATSSTTGSLITTYTYDNNGNRESVVYTNGAVEVATESYRYNKANMVKTLTNDKGLECEYRYYEDGNLMEKRESRNGILRWTEYEYDELGRLKYERESGNASVMYEYDNSNNRTRMNYNGGTTTYAYDENNRLKTEFNEVGSTKETTNYKYDKNGNQLTKLTESTTPIGNGLPGVNLLGDMVEICTYDGFNRLVTQFANGHNMKYSYRPDGLRNSKTVDGVKTDFIWSGSMMVAEVKNGAVTGYVYGINLIKSGSTYYLYNAHGDVVQLVNSTGEVIKTYDYDAFGVEKNPDENDVNPFRYCGEYYDLSSGTYYLRARYYQPTTGRFTQQDGWSYMNPNDPLSLNLYTYCYNNPIMWVDSSGCAPMAVGTARGPSAAARSNYSKIRTRYPTNIFAKIFYEKTRTGKLDTFLYFSLGAEIDSVGVYHLRQDGWQSKPLVGYNSLYDTVFNAASSMDAIYFDFYYNQQSLRFWAWKGDYLNLGAGAELGIYSYGFDIFGMSHWYTATQYAMQMTLQLNDNRGNQIFYWEPSADQWWITGFYPQMQGIDASNLTAIYTLYFPTQAMYNDAYYASFNVWKDRRWIFDPNTNSATFKF